MIQKRLQDRLQVEWQPFAWRPKEHRRSEGSRGVRVASFARQLMAMERSKMLHQKPEGTLAHLQGKRFGAERRRAKATDE